MTSLIDLLNPRYAPIQRALLDYLNSGAIARLTCTCKAFGCLWPTLMASDYDINYKLRYFFKDPREFRSVQGACNALIHDFDCNDGGLPNFLERSEREYTILLIEVELKNRGPLIEYLAAEGFTRIIDYSFDLILDDFYYWLRKVGLDGKGRHIKIYSIGFAIEHLLSVHHPTHKLHFLTWNKAYAIFAYETWVTDRLAINQASPISIRLPPQFGRPELSA